jgi:hypothetical protein
MANRTMVTSLRLLLIAGVIFLCSPQRASAQPVNDTTAVLLAVVKKMADPLNKGAAMPDRRIGLLSATFVYDSAPAFGSAQRFRTTGWLPQHIYDALAASNRHVKRALPFEFQPIACVPKQLPSGYKSTVCGMRDFDILISLSTPVITANRATVVLFRKQNGATASQPFSDGWIRYRLERGAGGGWTVTETQILQMS